MENFLEWVLEMDLCKSKRLSVMDLRQAGGVDEWSVDQIVEISVA